MNTIKLFDGTTIATTPETFHKDACASLAPWMEKGDKIARYPHGAGFIYYVSTYGELTDACAVVS